MTDVIEKNMETADERPHAEYGPSGLKPLAECAGYESTDESNEASERGDRIHHALQFDDTSDLRDELELDIFNQCKLDLADALDRVRSEAGGIEPVVHEELRLYMDLGATDTFGTADIVALTGKYALLLDFKSGIRAIDSPPENLQSLAYAIGVFQRFPEVDTIFAVFSIPQRQEFLDGYYYRSELKDYVRTAARIILNAERVRAKWADDGVPPLSDLEPNDNCRFCKHQTRCPALGYVSHAIVRRYDPSVLPADLEEVEFDRINDLRTRAALLKVANIVSKWAKNYRQDAKESALSGDIPEGFKLKSYGTPRAVTDSTALIEVAEEFGITTGDLLAAATYKLGPLVDIVNSRAPHGQKGARVKAFEQRAEESGAVTRQQTRIALVSVEGGDDLEED